MTIKEKCDQVYTEGIDKIKSYLRKDLEKLREQCKKDLPDEALESTIHNYSFLLNRIDQITDEYKKELDQIEPAIKEMEQIEYWATNLFGDIDFKQEAEDKISFKVPSRTISAIVIALATRFKWEATYFGFTSSFTTHEARTAFDKIIKVGIHPDDNNRVLINYNFGGKIWF